MSTESTSRCLNCGFEAPPGADEWNEIDAPPLGSLTQCPECESTDVITGHAYPSGHD